MANDFVSGATEELVTMPTSGDRQLQEIPWLPQYNMNLGGCIRQRQAQEFSNWHMYMPADEQRPETLVLYLQTHNVRAMADAYQDVTPRDFAVRNVYFAYWNTSGVKELSRAVDDLRVYMETSSFYRLNVSAERVWTVKDMKNEGFRSSMSAMFTLKATLPNTTLTPSTRMFKVTIYKSCSGSACSAIPDPAKVFVSRLGHVVYSIGNVQQGLTINGSFVQNHAWCPVQAVINVPSE